MNIENLKDVPQHLTQLAQWHHAEWSYLNPGTSLQGRIDKMQAYLKGEFLPSTWVAHMNDQPLGSAAIVQQDMDIHLDKSPWLASVFVSPESRKQGTGSALVRQVMDAARQQGVPRLWLYTPDKASFYKQLGWSVFSEEEYHGHRVTIMSVQLSLG